jgi:hypothetical protein
MRPYLRSNIRAKIRGEGRPGGLAQAVERLPSKHKTLSLNPSTKNRVSSTEVQTNFTWQRAMDPSLRQEAVLHLLASSFSIPVAALQLFLVTAVTSYWSLHQWMN